jgi:tellurite resistance protein
MEFFPEIALTQGEAETIARGLLSVARADGQLHEREIAMVQSFYAEIAGTSAAFAAFEKEPDIDPSALADRLSREEVAMLFVKTCILCSYADGQYHPKEKAKVNEYAKALGIGAPALAELEQSVKEFLVSHVAGLKNREAALAVAKGLDV